MSYYADFLHMCRLRQKQQMKYSDFEWLNRLVLEPGFSIGVWSVGRGEFPPIAWEISKILVGGNESFLPTADFHGHEL